MDIKEQLKDIKTQLRLSMNGVVSQSMREKGLNYKLNFGVELPRIKSIAAAYEKNHELAQTLWKEDIRECKILAGLLQPVETFLSGNRRYMGREHAEYRDSGAYLYESFSTLALCHRPNHSIGRFGRGVCADLRFPYYCPFAVKKGVGPSVLPENFWIRLFVLFFPAAIMCVMPLCLPSVNICSTVKNTHFRFAVW